jgi:hypothetical protein
MAGLARMDVIPRYVGTVELGAVGTVGWPAFIVVDLVRFGAILARRGEADAAAQLVACSDRLQEEIVATRWSWAAEEREEAVAIIHVQLDEVRFAEAWERGLKLTVDEAFSLAFNLA